MITKINNKIEKINNQYFYGEPVGVYIINLENEIVLFDLPTYSKELEHYLIEKKKPITAFLSHGSTGIPDGKIWQKNIALKIYLHESDQDNLWLSLKPDILFENIPFIDENIEIIHTPGHSKGSICLYDHETKTLLTGDTFGGTKKGTVKDFRIEDARNDIPKRLLSCKKVLNYDFKTVLPFHYEPIIGSGKKALQDFINVVGI